MSYLGLWIPHVTNVVWTGAHFGSETLDEFLQNNQMVATRHISLHQNIP